MVLGFRVSSDLDHPTYPPCVSTQCMLYASNSSESALHFDLQPAVPRLAVDFASMLGKGMFSFVFSASS